MKMEYVISSWDIPSLPIVGSNARFPVRRIFCVGRNYVEHQKEMGGDGREQPFFFSKSAHDLVPEGGAVHFPPAEAATRSRRPKPTSTSGVTRWAST